MSESDLMSMPDRPLTMDRPPALVLQEAQKAAAALKEIMLKKDKPVKFNGEQYIEFEDWQLVGNFYGYVAKVLSTEPVEYGQVRGFQARAVVIDKRTGVEISAADAMCLNDEEKWSARPKYEWQYVLADGSKVAEEPPKNMIVWIDNPEKPGKKMPKRERVLVGEVPVPMFQLRSMAQTRACAKALRNCLAWVVVLAGYKPSVAEEMTGDEHPGEEASAPAPAAPAMPQRKSDPKPATPAAAAVPVPAQNGNGAKPAAPELKRIKGTVDEEVAFHDIQKKAGGTFRKYTIKVSGQVFETVKEEVANTADTCFQMGTAIELEYITTQYANEIRTAKQLEF